MKTHPTQLLALLAAALFFGAFARAEDAAYPQILKKRDTVLSEILAARESRFASGTSDADSVLSARLALWSFRRDSAPSIAGKIRQQELIVGVWEKRLTAVEAQSKAGTAGSEAVLLATDSLLQAQQLLAELRLPLKQG